MYYPVGWHKVLRLWQEEPELGLISIQANHQRELFLVLTSRSLHVWYARPAVEIVRHKRSQKSLDELGHNRLAVWRTDSSEIVVTTDRDQLLFYHLRARASNSGGAFLMSGGASNSATLYNLNHATQTIRNILKPSTREAAAGPAPNQRNQSDPVGLPVEDIIPALDLFSFGKLDLAAAGVACLMAAEEQVIVATRNGNLFGVHWNGNIDDRFPWQLKNVHKGADYVTCLRFSSVISGFALVFYSGKAGFMPIGTNETSTHQQSEVNYFSLVSDAVCVEVNHRYRLVAIGTRNSSVLVCNLDESNSHLILNHRLQLSQANNNNSSNNPATCDPSNTNKQLGPIVAMQYSADNFALVTCWECGEFAIWSVFGSLLFCSQQWELESQLKMSRSVIVTSIAWGREGYSLWFSTSRLVDASDDTSSLVDSSLNSLSNGKAHSDEDRSESSSTKSSVKEEIHIMSLARSALSSSPHLACSTDAIILLSDDRVYIGPSVPHEDKFDHWLTVDIPLQYLHLNWPVKYATSDRETKNIALAGGTGFAVYSITGNKWRFSNSHDDYALFSVCGDIIWWMDYLILPCFNLETDQFEIRGYDLCSEATEEWSFVSTQTRAEITRFSIFENRLLALYNDGTFGMFMLNLRRCKPKLTKKLSSISAQMDYNNLDDSSSTSSLPVGSSPRSSRSDSIMSSSFMLNNKRNNKTPLSGVSLQISPIENLVISNLQANSYCISSIALTRLHFKNNRDDDSILLNACGKLFLLEREVPNHIPTKNSSSPANANSNTDADSSSQTASEDSGLHEIETRVQSALNLSNSIHFATASFKSSDTHTSSSSGVTFKAISVIATNVEQFWISPEISVASELSYFKKSLWMSCGGANGGLQVWLPLLNDKNDLPTDLYVPDRIMLPIKCDIYPLAIRSSAPDVTEPDDAIVLGAESDVLFKDNKMFAHFPYCTVKRQCRVYLHKILRELLLNQHLGYYARKIAESCHNLPYFAHCLELLLHEVLEEEATSPVPLPDPMLPQVVKFIKEFPVYLETVVHCARKSELSMWSHLFDERAVGNPRRLFQECLEKNKLDTAASCLIILQSLDRNIVSHKMVRELMRAVKDHPKFNYLVQELETFMSRAELDYSNNSESASPSSL